MKIYCIIGFDKNGFVGQGNEAFTDQKEALAQAAIEEEKLKAYFPTFEAKVLEFELKEEHKS